MSSHCRTLAPERRDLWSACMVLALAVVVLAVVGCAPDSPEPESHAATEDSTEEREPVDEARTSRADPSDFVVIESRDAMTDEYEGFALTSALDGDAELGWACNGESMRLVLSGPYVGFGERAAVQWRLGEQPASPRQAWLLSEGRHLAAPEGTVLDLTDEARGHDRLRMRVFDSDGVGSTDHEFRLRGLTAALDSLRCSVEPIRRARERRAFVRDSIARFMATNPIVAHRETKNYYPTDVEGCDWRGFIHESNRVYFATTAEAEAAGYDRGPYCR